MPPWPRRTTCSGAATVRGFLADGRPASAITRQRSARARGSGTPPRTQARRPCRYTSARSTARASRRLRNHLSIFRLPERRVRVVELTTNGGRRTAGVNRSFSRPPTADAIRDVRAGTDAPEEADCAEHCHTGCRHECAADNSGTAADQEPDRGANYRPDYPRFSHGHVFAKSKAPTIFETCRFAVVRPGSP